MSRATPTREHSELVSRIVAAGRRWRARSALAGLLRLVVASLAALAALWLLDAWVSLPGALRLSWLAAVAVFAAWSVGAFVARPLLVRIDTSTVAAAVERRFPELGERLEASAELWKKRDAGRLGYSVDLIDALIVETARDVAGLDFRHADPARLAGRTDAWLAGATVLLLLSVVVSGERALNALERLSHPFAAATTAPVTILVSPGDVTLVSGEDLVVSAEVVGDRSGGPTLRVRPDGGREESRAMEPAGGAGESGSFAATVRGVRADLRYSVAAGEAASPWYEARVIDRPFVTGIRLEYNYPEYSGLVPRTVDENSGDITGLAGTRVGVHVRTSKPAARVALVTESGRRVAADREGPRSFRADLLIRENFTYTIDVEDADGLTNPNPPRYSVVAVRDERPLVRIVEPGEDRDVPRDMMLPLVVSAIDDHGVSKLDIRYAGEGGAQEGVLRLGDFGARGRREIEREATWDLSETGIVPGSVLVYYAEVIDTDTFSGPKTARSESYTLRFPSMAELYQDAVGEQDNIIEELEGLLDEQAEAREQFEEIQEELRSEPEMDWQDEERVEEALARQEEIVENVESAADMMFDLSEQMSATDRATLETLEKLDELSRLMDDVATEEMRRLLDELREAMERVSPERMSEAMDQVELSQDDYMRRIEQTLNLLKRAKAEQELADVAKRVDDLADLEARLAEEASRSPGPARSSEMAAEQERASADLERLKEDLEKAIADMSEVDPDAAQEMREAAEQLESSSTAESMKKAAENLAAAKPGEAAPQCESASNDLKSLFTQLSECQGNMSCKLTGRSREATLRAIDDLIGVSTEQEKVVASIGPRMARPLLVELVAKEVDLHQALSDIADRLFRVSKDTYEIDPAVFRGVGIIQLHLAGAGTAMSEGGVSAGARDARAALGAINSLVVDLLTSSQSSSSQSGGSALEQLMQQLQRMAEQQSRLNDATEELGRQLQEQGASSQLERQLAGARAQQQRLLEEARRLAREFGDRREVLGRLDDTAEEMERALNEMERSGASQETIDRQKRILSRLLDAQRSLRRRDYSRVRRSRVGERRERGAPGALPEDLTRATQELREDLLRAMQQEYPPEYRELIRAYFEALSRDVEGGEVRE